METLVKLKVLADAAKYDASCASSGSKRSNTKGGLGNSDGTGICHSYTPDGRCVSLLKILFTNHCLYDCRYCINRLSNDVKRARFSVDEVVDLTIGFYKRNYIEGLFLSSGVIRDPDYTMDQLTEVARKLREDHRFNGYIHLKAVVGASEEALLRAGRHADRLSANIELPKQDDLDKLAPEKTIEGAEGAMTAIKGGLDASAGKETAAAKASSLTRGRAAFGRRERFAPAGQSTQMIVGATATPDADILTTANRLYGRHGLKRVYYTAYSPIEKGHYDLPTKAPPLVREHRLYQTDWLLRFYGFGIDELRQGVVQADGNLDLEVDPKTSWALANRHFFPVDLNKASKEQMLRVPGLGVRTVGRLLGIRKHRRVKLEDLKKLRVAMKRCSPFVVAADGWGGTKALDGDGLRASLLAKGKPEPQMALFGAA